MKTVNWSFVTSSGWYIDHPECVKPLLPENYKPFSSLSKHMVAERKGIVFMKCPAHTDFLKNTFIFHAPFDITINIDVDIETGNGKIVCDNLSQEVFDTIIDTRFLFDDNRGISEYPLLGIDWLLTFQSNESTMIQLLPAFFHYNDFTEKTTIVPGEFDISKWTRSVEIAFEVKKPKASIEIKKGDALAYFKFYSNEPIKLVEQPNPWDDAKVCCDIRLANTNRPLKERYAALEKAKAAGCPHKS